MPIRAFIICGLSLMLAACGGGADADIDALEQDLAANSPDPAVMTALQDQIMVDPQLSGQANLDAIRPPTQPGSALVPIDTVAGAKPITYREGELMRAPDPATDKCAACDVPGQVVTLAKMSGRALATLGGQQGQVAQKCAAQMQYSIGWTTRMPADMPLHPQARVVDAAGVDGNGCTMRAVSFSTPQRLQVMLDFYYTRAARSNFAAQHQARDGLHVLGGTRKQDGAQFIAYLSVRTDGGTDIDLITSGAR